MIGFFIIEKFIGDNDSAGFKTAAWCASKMDMNLKTKLYLPPYLRKSQCGIDVGDSVFGISDDTTGLGAALFGEGSADFGYFFNADIEIKKGLKVNLDVECDSDVKAGTISLKDHWHGYIDTDQGAPKTEKTTASNTPAVIPG